MRNIVVNRQKTRVHNVLRDQYSQTFFTGDPVAEAAAVHLNDPVVMGFQNKPTLADCVLLGDVTPSMARGSFVANSPTGLVCNGSNVVDAGFNLSGSAGEFLALGLSDLANGGDPSQLLMGGHFTSGVNIRKATPNKVRMYYGGASADLTGTPTETAINSAGDIYEDGVFHTSISPSSHITSAVSIGGYIPSTGWEAYGNIQYAVYGSSIKTSQSEAAEAIHAALVLGKQQFNPILAAALVHLNSPLVWDFRGKGSLDSSLLYGSVTHSESGTPTWGPGGMTVAGDVVVTVSGQAPTNAAGQFCGALLVGDDTSQSYGNTTVFAAGEYTDSSLNIAGGSVYRAYDGTNFENGPTLGSVDTYIKAGDTAYYDNVADTAITTGAFGSSSSMYMAGITTTSRYAGTISAVVYGATIASTADEAAAAIHTAMTG